MGLHHCCSVAAHSLLGAGLTGLCGAAVVSQVLREPQGHRRVAVVHTHHGNLLIRRALALSTHAPLGLRDGDGWARITVHTPDLAPAPVDQGDTWKWKGGTTSRSIIAYTPAQASGHVNAGFYFFMEKKRGTIQGYKYTTFYKCTYSKGFF